MLKIFFKAFNIRKQVKTLKCVHCGASNSDGANFCAKCAVRLSFFEDRIQPLLAGRSTEITVRASTSTSTSAADSETVVRRDESLLIKNNSALHIARQVDRGRLNLLTPEKIAQNDKRVAQRNQRWMFFCLTTLATCGSAFACWETGSRPTDDVPKMPLMASSFADISPKVRSTALTSQASLNLPATSSVRSAVTPVDVFSNDRKAHKRASKRNKAKTHRAALLQRNAKNRAAIRANAERAIHRENLARDRATALPTSKDEVPRLIKRKPMLQSPQQACADRSNFISRGICESRECEKPERANLKFCIDMHDRRAPHD